MPAGTNTPVVELWACHTCRMIGTRAEAAAHRVVIGHDVEQLPEDVTAALLAEPADA